MKRAALASAIAAAALLPARAEFVWLEAESAAAGNFPPAAENPFAPKAFWEEDLLSGGAWTGMYWDKTKISQPFLEFDFEAADAGSFALYARKFYTFGNFRWRVDEGPWQSVPQALHDPLDTVSLRDTGDEKFTLTWHYMGSVPLEPGRHRLRIEPLGPQPMARRAGQPELPGYPLAYDVFVLTTEPFFPAGKLKPGERFDSRSGSAYAFQPGRDPFEPSPVDWRALNEAFAGEQGGLAIRDGKFVLKTTGLETRLVGVNLSYGQNAAPETVRHLARSLAKRGVNLARFDLGGVFTGGRDGDGNPALELNREALAKLLDLIAALKQEGIYTALTWNLSNVKNAAALGGFGEDPLPAGTIAGDLSPHIVFDPRFQKLVKEGWKEVLGSPLPGGGPLGADPALAFLTLGQQVSLLSEPEAGRPETPAEVRRMMEAAFSAWLEKKYKSPDGARKAWAAKGAEIPDGPLLPSPAEMARNPDARARDAARFLAEAQREWFGALAEDIRQRSGYKGLVSLSNRPVTRPDILGMAAAWSSLGGDFSERAGLFVNRYESPDNPWVIFAGARFRDRSALRFDAAPGAEGARFDLPLKALSFAGKPSVLSEIGWTAPNRYRAEMPLLAFTLGAAQGVQVLGFQTLSGFTWHQSLPNTRLPLFTPAGLGQFPALAYAFRQGFLPGPFEAAAWSVRDDDFFSLEPPPVTDLAAGRISGESAALSRPENAPHPALFAAGRIAIKPGAREPKLAVSDEAAASVSDDGVETPGGAIRWDAVRGVFVVNAPKFQAAGGFLSLAGPQATPQMTVSCENDFAVVCLVALDGKPLDFSSKMLLQVMTEERNAGEFIEGSGLRVLRSVGRPPIVVEGIRGTFTLNRPDAAEILATALDPNGYPVLPAGSAAGLRLLPATCYYLLEK